MGELELAELADKIVRVTARAVAGTSLARVHSVRHRRSHMFHAQLLISREGRVFANCTPGTCTGSPTNDAMSCGLPVYLLPKYLRREK